MVKYPFYSRGILHFAQLLQEHFTGYKEVFYGRVLVISLSGNNYGRVHTLFDIDREFKVK